MKKTLKLMTALFVGAMFMGACQQAEEPAMEPGQNDAAVTRAYGDKTPKITIYVETNDVNPLNAGDYVLDSNGEPYADIVELFAANIRRRTVNGVTEPVLYLNDKMTNLMENDGYLTYIKPLQDKGIKVLLTILGDHQGIGFANMNDTQTTQFAKILAHAVEKYGLDGIGFDDEYADYDSSLVPGSFGNLILKLRNEMPAGKLISLFQYGNIGTTQINAAAGAEIDHVFPVVVPDGGCPRALPVVGTLVVAKRDRRVDMVDDRPVDQVLRVQDRDARSARETRGDHIVVIPHPQHVGVGIVGIDDRVAVRAVAVVGGPDLGTREGKSTEYEDE